MRVQVSAYSRDGRARAGNLIIESNSPLETATIAEQLGLLLEEGDVLLLQGELGAGKTCFTQGLGRGLGIGDLIASPTFVLVSEYAGTSRLYHADLYRLENPAEVADLDLARATEDGVLVVEWPERAPEWLPRNHLLVAFTHTGEASRTLEFVPSGARADLLSANLAAWAAD